MVNLERHVVSANVPHSISCLIGFIKYLGFRRIVFDVRQRAEHEITAVCGASSMCGCGR